jgi:peptide/nickel transport system substrate-binding protein
MRRTLTLWLVVLLSFTLVAAACGDDDDGSGSGDDTSAPDDTGDSDGDADDNDDAVLPADNVGDGLEGEQLTDTGEGGDNDDALEPEYGGILEWGLNRDGTGFDTTGAVAPGTARIINALADPLVNITADGEWVPNMAESLVPNEENTVWTIGLRPGVTFHDGEPVDGAAVAANLNAFKAGLITSFAFVPFVSATALDDLTVEVQMNRPWGAFPYILVGQPGWMVSPSTIGNNDTFVGTGPFKLDNWTPGEGATVSKFDDYWRDGFPYLDGINFTFIPEQSVRRLALEGDDVDGYISPGDADILAYLDDDSIDVWIGEGNGNEMLYLLNTAVAPLDDLRVRRALAYATQPSEVISAYRSGLTIPATGPIHPGSRWYNPDAGYPEYDLDMAIALIEEYEAEVGPVEFEISSEAGASFIEVTELVMAQWRDAGVEVSIRDVALGASATTAISDDFEAFAWIQFSSPDPDGFYHFFHSGAGILNWSNLTNTKIDEGLDAARNSTDFGERKAGYDLFQEGLAEDVPMIWIDHFNGLEGAVSRPYVHGIKEQTLPGGEEGIGMINGSFFLWEDVWMEQS